MIVNIKKRVKFQDQRAAIIKFINWPTISGQIHTNLDLVQVNCDGNSDKFIFDDIFSGIFGYHKQHTHVYIFYYRVHLIDVYPTHMRHVPFIWWR